MDTVVNTEHSPVICKRCGRDSADAPLKVTEEVMKRYLRSVLGGKPFTNTFSIADGKISAEFQEISADVADKLQRVLRNMDGDSAINSAVDFKLLFTLKKLELIDEDGTVVVKYDSKNFADKINFDKDVNVAAKFEEFSKYFDEVLLGILRRMSIAFALLLKAITDQLTSSDFYDGVGLL